MSTHPKWPPWKQFCQLWPALLAVAIAMSCISMFASMFAGLTQMLEASAAAHVTLVYQGGVDCPLFYGRIPDDRLRSILRFPGIVDASPEYLHSTPFPGVVRGQRSISIRGVRAAGLRIRQDRVQITSGSFP